MSNAVVDLVEYEHTPAEGYEDGLFGVFKARRNPDYDHAKKGSLQFVKHRDVPRERIIVYNVEVFGPASELRISITSLNALSHDVPGDVYCMPTVIPDTHAQPSQSRTCAGGSGSDAANNHSGRRRSTPIDRPIVQRLRVLHQL